MLILSCTRRENWCSESKHSLPWVPQRGTTHHYHYSTAKPPPPPLQSTLTKCLLHAIHYARPFAWMEPWPACREQGPAAVLFCRWGSQSPEKWRCLPTITVLWVVVPKHTPVTTSWSLHSSPSHCSPSHPLHWTLTAEATRPITHSQWSIHTIEYL